MAEKASRTILCRNLTWNVTKENLLKVPQFEAAINVNILIDEKTGRPRGFGFIEFSTAKECQKALENSEDIEIDGKLLALEQSFDKRNAVADIAAKRRENALKTLKSLNEAKNKAKNNAKHVERKDDDSTTSATPSKQGVDKLYRKPKKMAKKSHNNHK